MSAVKRNFSYWFGLSLKPDSVVNFYDTQLNYEREQDVFETG
jgi:hypothetical protein